MTLSDAGGASDGDNLYNWSLASAMPTGGTLPSGTNLPAGQYSFSVTSFDRYNNTAQVARTFYVNPSGGADSTAPVITFTSPVSEGVYNPGQLPTSLSGTVRDPNSSNGTPASGVGRMHARLCRNWSGTTVEFWNGSVWSTTDTPYIITVGAPDANGVSNWSVSNVPVPPAGTNLPSGRYYFSVVAYDRSNNGSSAYDYVRVVPNDTTPPVVALTSIASESVVTALPATFSGTASDPNAPDGTVGSGVGYVNVRFLRSWDGTTQYWNGTAWSTTSYATNATLSPDGTGNYTWSCTPAPAQRHQSAQWPLLSQHGGL